MSESAGGRVDVFGFQRRANRDPKSIPASERWYFLEEWYPKYGNLVPRDVATRAIFKVVFEHNLAIDGKPMGYLEPAAHIDRKILDRELHSRNVREVCSENVPARHAHEDFPGMFYTMGGL